MRVVLVGATGYLGSAVAAALGDLRVARVRALAELDSPLSPTDAVINCAGHVGSAARALDAANVALAETTARGVAAAGARLIHVSSAAVFDGVRAGPLPETASPRARSAYGRSKLRGEEAVRRELPAACIVRPSKIIGGDDPRARLQALVRYADAGRPLPVPTSAGLWANFVAVDDARAVLRDLATGAAQPPPIVHLTATVPWPQFVAMLEDAIGKPVARTGPLVAAVGGAVARGTALLPPHRVPRRLQRLQELWDRQQLVDSTARLSRDGLAAALAAIVERAR